MATLTQTAEQIYTCTHTHEDGTSAFIGFGNYDDDLEQCILCGKVVDPKPEEDVPGCYGIGQPY